MKPIREQLREQAETIRQEWARGPSSDGSPRVEAITLTLESTVLPMRAIRDYRGRVNSDETHAGKGCLLFRGGRAERTWNGTSFAQRFIVSLEYREWSWNWSVRVAAVTHFPPGPPKILVDSSGKPVYPTADFDEWLDALEPPCGGTSSAPDDPSPEPGSWRTRRGLL